MNYLLASLFVLILAVGFIVGTVYWTRSLTFPDSGNQESCEGKQDVKNGNCTIFQDDVCWKGKCDSTPCKEAESCTKKSHPGPLILMVAGIVSFIASIVLFVLNFTSNHKEIIVRHEYGSSLN